MEVDKTRPYDSLGVDIMGTETELGKYLNDHDNFEYEYGTVIIQDKKINFFRVTDVADLLRKSIDTLNSEGILQPDQNNPELLRLLIRGDKGEALQQKFCGNF